MTATRSRCVSCRQVVPTGEIASRGRCRPCAEAAPLLPAVSVRLPTTADGRVRIGSPVETPLRRAGGGESELVLVSIVRRGQVAP